MISQPSQPDPIDQLLEKITREADHESLPLATFLQRAVARIIDTAIAFGFGYGAQVFFLHIVRSQNQYNVDFLVKSVEELMPAMALMFWVLVYSPVLESTGGTLGKRLMRIRLVDLQSQQIPDFRMCMARTWIYLVFVVLSAIPATLITTKYSLAVAAFGPMSWSCLAFFVSDYHQTWHDKLTGIICIKKNQAA